MNTVQLNQIQKVELEILDEILRLCEKHNIHYVAMGGTCLGAIRHKGMIPWDDDIDLGMCRDDYNRFVAICENELNSKFFFQHFDSEEHYGFIFGKIRKNETLLVETYSKNVQMHQGIWIDIFPFDYVANDENEHARMYSKVIFYRNLLAVKEHFSVKKDDTLTTKVLFYLVKLVIWAIPKKTIVNKVNSLMQIHNKTKTNTLFPYGCAWGLKERISIEDFFDTIPVPFNDRKIKVFRSYDKYLTRLYGDYMTPPPLEKRDSGHDLFKVKV